MKILVNFGKFWNIVQLLTIIGDRVRKGIKVLKVLIGISKVMKMYFLFYLQIWYSKWVNYSYVKRKIVIKKNCDFWI